MGLGGGRVARRNCLTRAGDAGRLGGNPRRYTVSHTYYSEINLHLVWHTKNNRPLLSPEVEKAAHGAIRQRALRTPGVILHAVIGTEDHVHVAVSIPPMVPISTFIGDVKGYSSHTLNQLFSWPGERFAWQ